MRTLVVVLLALTAGALILGGSAIAADKVISVKMNGKQESPKGSPTGSGTAKITLEPSRRKICFRLAWSGIGPPTASHIHKGPRGKAGNVVVVLFGNPPAKHSGCVSAKRTLISAIAKTPGAYYVNIHTKKYPLGAIRGQL